MFSLHEGLRRVLSLQTRLPLRDRSQPAFAAGQLRGQVITTTVTVDRVLGRVGPFRFGDQRPDLPGEFTFSPDHPVITHRPVPAR